PGASPPRSAGTVHPKRRTTTGKNPTGSSRASARASTPGSGGLQEGSGGGAARAGRSAAQANRARTGTDPGGGIVPLRQRRTAGWQPAGTGSSGAISAGESRTQHTDRGPYRQHRRHRLQPTSVGTASRV